MYILLLDKIQAMYSPESPRFPQVEGGLQGDAIMKWRPISQPKDTQAYSLHWPCIPLYNFLVLHIFYFFTFQVRVVAGQLVEILVRSLKLSFSSNHLHMQTTFFSVILKFCNGREYWRKKNAKISLWCSGKVKGFTLKKKCP